MAVAVLVDGGGGCGELGLSSVVGTLALLTSLLLSCLLQRFALACGGSLLLGSGLLLLAFIVASIELEGDVWWWSRAKADGSRVTRCGV